MTIVLIRHAHAVDRGSFSDEARWLSETGRRVARRAGTRLLAAGLVPDVFVASPLVRTVQTAELVAAGLKWAGTIEVLPALSPSGSPRIAVDELRAMGAVVAAVGHEPGMSTIAALLTNQRSFDSFRKGEVIVVSDGKVTQTFTPEK